MNNIEKIAAINTEIDHLISQYDLLVAERERLSQEIMLSPSYYKIQQCALSTAQCQSVLETTLKAKWRKKYA